MGERQSYKGFAKADDVYHYFVKGSDISLCDGGTVDAGVNRKRLIPVGGTPCSACLELLNMSAEDAMYVHKPRVKKVDILDNYEKEAEETPIDPLAE